MRIRDLMTTDVITVSPETSIKSAASQMVEAGVSGLVVTNSDDEVVGILSEADFVKSAANRGSEERAGLLRWFARPSRPEIAGTHVGEIMTTPVLIVAPGAKHQEAARLMDRKGVKRLPVVEDGELIGIISRADIVRAFNRSDEEIRNEIVGELLPHVLWIDPERLRVTCDDGVVQLQGQLATKVDAELVEYMAGRVDGVIGVEANLSWEFNPAEHTSQPILANPFQHLINR